MSMQFVTPPQTPAARTIQRRPAADDVAEAFETCGQRLSLHRDEEIYCEGDPTTTVYKVVSGVVRTYRLLSDGRRQIEEFHFAGDIFGLEPDVERRISAEAVGDTELRTMQRSVLTDRAERDSQFARRLWAITAQDLRKSRDHILTLGRRSASERVAGFLTDLADRQDAQDELDIPMSRQDIADYLGLTIETVSRTFSQLQGSGCIRIPTCRRIVVRDADRLLDMCG